MRTITFTPEDLRDLAHDRYHHPDPRVQRKMEVLWLKSHGLSHDAIAADADISRRSVLAPGRAIPVPPKKTVEEHAREQATFVQEQLEPRLEQARQGQRPVYFVDA